MVIGDDRRAVEILGKLACKNFRVKTKPGRMLGLFLKIYKKSFKKLLTNAQPCAIMYSESEGSEAKPLEGRDIPEAVRPTRVSKSSTIKSSTARSPRYAVYKCAPNASRSGVELGGSRRGE
jgi:hypothetical protein